MRSRPTACRPRARRSAFPTPLPAAQRPPLIHDGADQIRNNETTRETADAGSRFADYGFQFLLRCGGPWSCAPAGLPRIALVLGSSCLVSFGGSMRTFLA